MVIRKRKKTRRMRGSRSHGWGVTRDHKGRGMRGGGGNAGVFSHHWLRVIKEGKLQRKKQFTGRYGFLRPQMYLKKYKAINVSHLNQQMEKYTKLKLVELDKNDSYVINLQKLGITKLLAQGEVTKKMQISVQKATPRAISKIEKAGGSVQLLS